MSPVLPPSLLIVLAVLVLALAGIGAWTGAATAPKRLRVGLLAIRLAAVAAIVALLLNPGAWKRPRESQPKPWIVLVDASPSMKRSAAAGSTRAEVAGSLVRQAADQAARARIPLLIRPFAGSLGLPLPDGETKVPPGDDDSTDIFGAVHRLLDEATPSGQPPAGIIVVSDGRQTATATAAGRETLALRARGRAIPVHTVAVGTDAVAADLALVQPRASFTAFPGQPLRIPFALTSTGLPALRPVVTLRDSGGKTLATLQPEIPPDATVTAHFDLPAPDRPDRWTIETAATEGELRPANNRSAFNIRVLDSRTRVFLVEGAPYWDSKFLAQLLRQQSHMDLRSIHRLSEQRYFRIDSGSDENQETTHPVFPDTLDEISRFDLVVFGKHVDSFLTDERAALIREYVRDRGGALLFSRGRATTSASAAIAPLEPVDWGAANITSFRFAPNADGEAAGLFGQALPAPDASLWASLPPLKDARQVATVKPFTRVLADGHPDASAAATASGRFPALVVRRYGQGVVAMVNGDGLWKWDFFPEARELGNCYEDFWTQLIQWMVAYSEFLPGQDFSLRAPAGRVDAGTTVALTASYRGPDPAPEPRIEVIAPGGETSRLQPATLPAPSSRPLWRATLTPDQPGLWTVRVVDPRPEAPPTPEIMITVPHPATESDDLTPDPAFLADLAKATGGSHVSTDDFAGLLGRQLVAEPPASFESGAVWKASWANTPTAVLLTLLLASEWFLRRRNGMP